MTKECALIDGIIYCQCGDQSSHYGTMGKRGAREVRCEAPPQRSSKDVSRRLKEIYDALWINCEPMQQWHAERLAAIITELNSTHEPPAGPADDVEVNRCLYVAGLQQDDASHAAHVTACKVLAAEVRRLRSALPPVLAHLKVGDRVRVKRWNSYGIIKSIGYELEPPYMADAFERERDIEPAPTKEVKP